MVFAPGRARPVLGVAKRGDGAVRKRGARERGKRFGLWLRVEVKGSVARLGVVAVGAVRGLGLGWGRSKFIVFLNGLIDFAPDGVGPGRGAAAWIEKHQ